jgi:hypothetical protein
VTARLALVAAVLSCAFLGAHVARLPQTLEDIDSVNFALGVERFDVPAHRPHPPGYPVYIALARASTALVGVVRPDWGRDHRAAAGLALLGAVAGALALLVFWAFWVVAGLAPLPAILAAALATASPLFWFTASRPLSDTLGVTAAVAVQTWLVSVLRRIQAGSAPVSWSIPVAAFAAAFIVGIRSQTLWLTGPLLLWVVLLLGSRGRFADLASLLLAFCAGGLAWAVPLVQMSGGLDMYLRVLAGQGAEDFAGVEMLATAPTWRLFENALAHTFVDAWRARTLAHVVLGLALIGFVRLALRRRPILAIVAVAFLPYLCLHLALQESATTRYGLPMVVPVAGLAVIALDAVGVYAAVIGASALAVIGLVLTDPVLVDYSARGAPVFRAFQDMQRSWPSAPETPLLKMHHQVWWGVRRALEWYRPIWNVGAQPFPGDREWLSVVEHFRGGERRPVWFLSHVSRANFAMFDHRALVESGRYAPAPELRMLIGGTRLDSLVWQSIERPGWMLGRGWAVSPELAGVTEQDRLAGRRGPAEAFVLARPGPQRIVVGGRYLGADDGPPATLSVLVDEHRLDEWVVAAKPRWFVRWVDVPASASPEADSYRRLVVRVDPPADGERAALVGLEQFDAAPVNEPVVAFVEGWHEREADAVTGVHWQWTSASSTLEIRGAERDRTLTIAGESPLRYFTRAPRVVVRAGPALLHSFTPEADFSESVALPARVLAASSGRVTIETNETFSPSASGSPDQRVLGLRLFSVVVR